MKNQLTARGVLIGCVGCALITASSVYVALKMGALPWPIVFAALVSLVALKAISKGKASLHEVNVTHTVMSSGAMVAGGLAFTIPGAWMLGIGQTISLIELLVIALSGSAVGLVASLFFRKHFIADAQLEFPMGQAAAQALRAGNSGGKTGAVLFLSLGFAAVWALLRDAFKVIPSLLCKLSVPSVAFGLYASPLMLGVGLLVGTGAMAIWFAGALIANIGVVVAFPLFGIIDSEQARQIVSCAGMGIMLGCGVAVIVRDIIPLGVRSVQKKLTQNEEVGEKEACAVKPRIFSLAVLAICAIALCTVLQVPTVVAVVVVVCAFIACAMSAQSVGQTSIDPMEIFGLIALFIVTLLGSASQLQLFFVAAIVAVACGLAGDVMSDFKAGAILGTNPKAQWVGQAIGAVVGSIVAALVVGVLFQAYGPESFGVGKEFVAAQASVVATMIEGVPHMPAFLGGLVFGFLLYLVRFPSMMLGLGMYLPFYLSFTPFVGMLLKLCIDFLWKRHVSRMSAAEQEQRWNAYEDTCLIIASGLLGGESIMGIVLAMMVAATAVF